MSQSIIKFTCLTKAAKFCADLETQSILFKAEQIDNGMTITILGH